MASDLAFAGEMEQGQKICEVLREFVKTFRARIARVANSRPTDDVAEHEQQKAKFNEHAQARVELRRVYIKTLK
eukprot:10331429-Lingulodinium_polyedra.AAC.1